jgi:hypothetical protein
MIKKGIPYGKQEITQEDIDSVINVLKSDFLTQGPEIDKFEKEFANYVGASYAIAVSNGTAALHLANLAIGTKPGSRVITTPISFAASSNCVLYCGGQVEFVDIDPSTFLLDLNKLEDILKRAPAGTYSGIVSVDFAGLPVDMEAMRTIADNYELFIIQDACHSPGGFFVNSTGGKSYCGSCEYSDMTCFSFHPVKHIATGEGGMVTTNDEKLYDKLLALRTHGIVKDNTKFINKNARASESTSEEYPGWYMEMQYLGYNYRLTDIQSALGLSQLKRVDLNISKRQLFAIIVESSIEISGNTTITVSCLSPICNPYREKKRAI